MDNMEAAYTHVNLLDVGDYAENLGKVYSFDPEDIDDAIIGKPTTVVSMKMNA